MPLTPECIVRIAARRQSHNEFTGVTHSKTRADAVNTTVVTYCTPTNMRQSVRKPSVGCFRGASATMRGVRQAR
jgi:hypothetical protein